MASLPSWGPEQPLGMRLDISPRHEPLFLADFPLKLGVARGQPHSGGLRNLKILSCSKSLLNKCNKTKDIMVERSPLKISNPHA